MRFLFFFLISLPVYSNTFQLVESGARFTLKISKSELTYQSETLFKKFPIKDCNLMLAKDLNAELLSKIPSKSEVKGLKLLVDDKELTLAKSSELATKALAMDSRMIRFIVEEKEACK